MPFRILSIDGGGIRGIIPAMILAELERRSGKPIVGMFDLIAGTSTGGILALGVTAPGESGGPKHAAEELVGFYEEEGPKIFRRGTWHRIRAVGNLAEERYPSEGIEEVLGRRFGGAWLSEVLRPVLIPAYDIEVRQPHFFKSSRALGDARRDFRLADVARATSAAPTYFEPARIASRDGDAPVSLVDGGVYANNPAACALVEAICDHGAHPADIVVLSLGTGERTRPILHEDAASWGLARWAQPILSVVFDGVSDTVDYQVQSIVEATSGPGRYLRVQTVLSDGNDDMDDAGADNIRVLELLARGLISRNSREIDRMLEVLDAGRRRAAEPPPIALSPPVP